ncbi:MAG: type II secretion system protein N [Pseudomonadota bacterium]
MQSFNLFNNSHFAITQNRVEWQKYFVLLGARLAKIPLSQWQFGVRLVLVLCLSFSCARLFWLIFPSPILPTAVVIIAADSNHELRGDASINSLSYNIDKLKSLKLFGKSDLVKEVPPAIDIQSPETRLKLALMGVVTSNYEKMGRAMIGVDNNQDVYAVGAVLPIGEGIVLEKVMRDRIIISNNGQYEALFLYQNDAKAKAVVAISVPGASPEMAQWLEDHAEPEEQPQTEAAQAAALIAENQVQHNNNTHSKSVAAVYTGPITPEMNQWLKDHAAPEEEMITESP